MTARSCSSCDTPVPDDAAFCPNCGAATPTDLNVEFGEEFAERLSAALADRYHIEKELGRGGMAVVFLAHDLKYGRDVALKVMRPELAASIGTERFLREIQIAAKLNHPHILSIYDSGELAALLYYVMPFVEGESLRARMRREGPMVIEESLRIACEVASALSYAHSMGIVHRDIKPENILLHHGEAMVVDFGIARAVAEGETRLTETGIALGTPMYMSPEQASDTNAVSGSSDIYSLACVLFEMLTGEPPFSGASRQAVLVRHAVDPVPSVKTLRSTVPDYVDEAVQQALAKVPADRYTTGTEFAEALTGRTASPDRIESVASYASEVRGRSRLRYRPATGWLLITALVLFLVWVAQMRPSVGVWSGHVDHQTLAVWPFRLVIADSHLLDSNAVGLGSAVADLMYLATAHGGLRIIDVRSATSRWWELQDTLRAAADLRAGLLLDGTVTIAEQITATVSLRRIPSGGRLASDTVQIPIHRSHLLHREVAYAAMRALASLGRVDPLGPAEERLGAILNADHEARELYTRGMRALADSQYPEAAKALSMALEIDSTFALAAMELMKVGCALSPTTNDDWLLGAYSAWHHRGNLPTRDRRLLLARVRDYPHDPLEANSVCP